MIDPNPCKDCPDRYTACQDHCEKHKKWLDQLHAQQRHRKEQKARWYVPGSVARDKLRNRYNSGSMHGHTGGDQ